MRNLSYELVLERSKDLSSIKFPKDGEIWPIRMLLDKLSKCNPFKFPMTSKISPSNLLLERSMVVRWFWIFLYGVSMPLFVISREKTKDDSHEKCFDVTVVSVIVDTRFFHPVFRGVSLHIGSLATWFMCDCGFKVECMCVRHFFIFLF